MEDDREIGMSREDFLECEDTVSMSRDPSADMIGHPDDDPRWSFFIDESEDGADELSRRHSRESESKALNRVSESRFVSAIVYTDEIHMGREKDE